MKDKTLVENKDAKFAGGGGFSSKEPCADCPDSEPEAAQEKAPNKPEDAAADNGA